MMFDGRSKRAALDHHRERGQAAKKISAGRVQLEASTWICGQFAQRQMKFDGF
jgi:hypothetical protein